MRFEINRGLAAETAADLGRNHLDAALLHPQHAGAHRAHHERALRRAVDRRMAVRIVDTDGSMRLDIALMDHRGMVLALDHVVGRLEPGLYAPPLELHMVGDVRLLLGTFFL